MSYEPGRVSNAVTVSGSITGPVIQAGGSVRIRVSGAPGRLPYRFGMMPPLARVFQDRAYFAAPLADDGVHTTILTGMAGVGKTQAVVAESNRAWEAAELDLLAWIDATSRESITTAYAALIADLTGASDSDPEVGARRLMDWLTVTSARWLVVLDGIQEPKDLWSLWPPVGQSSRVLATTRRRDAGLSGHRRRRLTVDPFSPAEARSHLHAVLVDTPELLNGAEQLAHDLGHLPLALSLAGAYLRERRISCAEYSERLADAGPQRAMREDWTFGASIVSLSLEQVDCMPPVGVARLLLEIASPLAASGIPLDLFETPSVLELLAERTGRAVTGGEVRLGLAGLQLLNLIDTNQGSFIPLMRVHPLVQRATWDSLSEPEAARLARSAADGLVELWSDVNQDSSVDSVLRANVTRLAHFADNELWRDKVHPVLVLAGRSLGTSWRAADAAAYFSKLSDTAIDRLGVYHPSTRATRMECANWRGEAGDIAGALSECGRVLDDASRVLYPDDPAILAIRTTIAHWRGEAGDYSAAVAELEAILRDRTRLLGPDHAENLVTRSNLAQWRGATGDIIGALNDFERLLDDSTRILGAQHPDTFVARNNLAQWRGEAGDPEAAVSTLDGLLVDRIRVLGPDHPDTLITRHNLASWRGRAGDPKRAVAELEELLNDQVRVLGPDHPGTDATRASFAQWLANLGDPRRAASELQRLLDGQSRASDASHPATLVIQSSLAAIYRQLGSYEQAQRLDAKVLDRRRQRLGPDHPDTLLSATNLAIDLRHLGDNEKALELDAEVLDRRRQRLGPDHPDTLLSATNLAIDLRHLGDNEKALEIERETVRQRQRLRPNHPDTRRSERSVLRQETLGPSKVFVSHTSHDPLAIGLIIDALQLNGMIVRTVHTSSTPGARWQEMIERELGSNDVVLVVLTEAGVSKQQRYEIKSALRQDALLIPLLIGLGPFAGQGGLPLEISARQSIRLDGTGPEHLDFLAGQVFRAVRARRTLVTKAIELTVPEGDAAMVRNAFAAADRPLRVDHSMPGLLWPGPVWVAEEPSPAELERFAVHLSHGQLGYLVHATELRPDALAAVDEMRLSGTPVLTISARSLRAAHADQRVAGFLAELERDHGNRDNLFDTKNALIDERFLFGRDLMLNTIGSALRRGESILLTGLRKVGKTSLLNILRQRLTDRPVCKVDLQRFDRHREDWPSGLFTLMVRAFDNWGMAEHKKWPFTPSSPVTATELEAALESRREYLRSEGNPANSMVVMLDELERIFPAPGEEQAARHWIRGSGALRALAQGDLRQVVVVGADLRPDVNRSNDLGSAGTNPFFAFFQETPLTLLDRNAVDRMIREIGQAMAIEHVSGDVVRELFELTGGHPSLIRTIAAEISRGRADRHAMTGPDLVAGVDRLHDDDAIGYFVRNNLWQLMTAAEQAVVRCLALDRPIPKYLPKPAVREARSALRAQGLIDDTVQIGLFRTWLRDEES
ncbi:tetratricopeptide repeat protein [Actinokineospora sp. 24-640]